MSNINEGVIDVPDELVKFVMDKVMKFVGNYIGFNLEPQFHQQINFRGKSITNTISSHELDKDDPGAAIGVKYRIDVSDVKYTDLKEDELVIGVHIHNRNHMYVPDSNMLAISIKDFVDRVDKVIVKAEDPSEQEDYYALVGTFDAINRYLESFYNTLKNVVKHELAHFIQFRYLKEKHKKQAEFSDDSSRESYFMSDIEYSPHIISAIEVFKHNAPLNKSPKEYFKYLVGMKAVGSMVMVDDAIEDRTAHEFFVTLKQKNTTLYKKAVKYLASSI